ncbi:hypothetical protein CcaverHIS002_0400190 [Cutaneotrichosporon cavernicola]|uniref:Major facilitator superfamily (MFS) profile domain-containing protein n=1 Tax=Cutaneotrichosporon cavernicola TaxID=279322 RepID=A0AA48QVB5_9TREE|nr:uncharacterized protein CcaverHIS019_0400190 [Cutaneotrichosporon cavernicola]BEI83415.1 hypothetical protein CcaverHIS002_0400190 [Cutaneotrichosporon cavernicola]BEI91199.1 hypothetical protein CcaverHIS019_0400190 [Cutaneotrichosporon cavernicola]BEI98972.1 hypothetical protein CcaverHIS631_0400150 [Cutaneotrichosporon cavernicola]BEJ06746.1 hypothetical protein CcaverHIS641_0400150 [Cutaneotrichosporon cavernicola]
MGFYSELTPRLALVSFLGSLGALSFGYDNGWWGIILGAPYFNDQFGHTVTTGPDGSTKISLSSTEQSCGSGLGTAGIMLGCMIAPYINNRWGRKMSFMVLAIIGIVGALVQSLSTIGRQIWVLIVGKVILNMSVGIASATVGVYLSECAPSSLRGVLMSNYNIVQNVGYVVAAATVFGVVLKTSIINWMLPIGLQFVLPIAILVSGPFLPESPRWLVSKGRIDEAVKVLRSLRVALPGEDLEAKVWAEVEEIKAAFEEMKALHEGVGVLELFRGANLRRTAIAVGLQCLQQAQGVGFVANYTTVLLLSLGISNVYVIVLVLYVVLLVTSLGAFYLPDKLGRRTLLLVGSASGAVWMGIIGAVSTVYKTPTGGAANLLVASLFLWISFFSNTWSPMPWTVAAEISSGPLREMTLALASFSGFGVGLIVTFVSPFIQETAGLGGKIAFIWMGFSVVSGVYAFFLVPELKGRSLEELDYMFEARIPTRKFNKFDSAVMMEEKRREHVKAEFEEEKQETELVEKV